MVNEVKRIGLERLAGHPDNANVQGKDVFGKLVRHIERTGLYEPLVVRPVRGRKGYYQVINGHHRLKALEKLGYESCDCVVWEVDDDEAGMLLLTLNRLGGTERLEKKLRILKRLNKKYAAKELGRLLPQNKKQIERMLAFRRPSLSLAVSDNRFCKAVVFFVSEEEESLVEEALSEAIKAKKGATRAVRRGAALVEISKFYISEKIKARKTRI
jgi:hypothetical protein